MDPLIVVKHPRPLRIEARSIAHRAAPEGGVALGYYYRGNLIARGAVAPETLEAIRSILAAPVHVALAATEDDTGNIDGRICLLLQVDPRMLGADDDDDEEPEEPWKASIPRLPSFEAEPDDDDDDEDPDGPQMVLLPIGNVVRAAENRNHPQDAAGDVQEMLDNLLRGRAEDAVSRAIDDLLRSL